VSESRSFALLSRPDPDQTVLVLGLSGLPRADGEVRCTSSPPKAGLAAPGRGLCPRARLWISELAQGSRGVREGGCAPNMQVDPEPEPVDVASRPRMSSSQQTEHLAEPASDICRAGGCPPGESADRASTETGTGPSRVRSARGEHSGPNLRPLPVRKAGLGFIKRVQCPSRLRANWPSNSALQSQLAEHLLLGEGRFLYVYNENIHVVLPESEFHPEAISTWNFIC